MDSADRLVVAQGLALTALGWPGRGRWALARAVTTAARGALVVGGGFATLGALPHGRLLTPSVTPPEGAALIRTGPYAVSRNPIYAGLLVGTAGLAVLRRRPEPLVAWVALLAVLTAKVRHEEQRLAARFGDDYRAYRRRVPRFVGPVHRSGRRP